MDKEKQFVLTLLEEIKPRKVVRDVIVEAYLNDFHKESDGCTVVSEYNFKYKHPTCVGHDYLYRKKQDTWTRYQADYWFLLANRDFGHPYRGLIRFIGVVAFGWIFWRRK